MNLVQIGTDIPEQRPTMLATQYLELFPFDDALGVNLHQIPRDVLHLLFRLGACLESLLGFRLQIDAFVIQEPAVAQHIHLLVLFAKRVGLALFGHAFDFEDPHGAVPERRRTALIEGVNGLIRADSIAVVRNVELVLPPLPLVDDAGDGLIEAELVFGGEGYEQDPLNQLFLALEFLSR